jgi:NADP-dependent 3-hydroxy acid dehydrogenase YdfG
MENKLSQKTAIITGGATGLGFAMAQKFAEHNIRIILIVHHFIHLTGHGSRFRVITG